MPDGVRNRKRFTDLTKQSDSFLVTLSGHSAITAPRRFSALPQFPGTAQLFQSIRVRGHVSTPNSGRSKARARSRTYFFTFAHRFFCAAEILARAAADIVCLLFRAFGVPFNAEIAASTPASFRASVARSWWSMLNKVVIRSPVMEKL
jgi:hypothetical protein